MNVFNEQEFESYANLVLDLVSLDKEDFLLIVCDFDHQLLVNQLLAQAYKRGAQYVQIVIDSDTLNGLRAVNSKEEFLKYFPKSMVNLYREFNDKRACIVSVRSPVDPLSQEQVSAVKLATINNTRRQALSFFHNSVITDYFSWIVINFPTVGWAKNVFPNLKAEKGQQKLWNVMKPILRLNNKSPIEAWKAQQNLIIRRRKYMNDKKYVALKFISKNTDLKIALHDRSVWLGAAHTSENKKYFQANLPTEELYTSPDCRFTEGYVNITRPLPIYGKRVSGISMKFKEGKICEARAEEGDDVFQQFLVADPRNLYLGEIALVDINSPIWKSGLVFNSILFDENAGVHFALGTAYTSGYGFKAGENIPAETLLEMGCNASPYHLDFVIGSELLSVYGITANNKEEPIIQHGLFCEQLT